MHDKEHRVMAQESAGMRPPCHSPLQPLTLLLLLPLRLAELGGRWEIVEELLKLLGREGQEAAQWAWLWQAWN